jgi:hypothetical protein
MGWVVNTTPRPLYPQERPGTHCIRGWVGPAGPVWTGFQELRLVEFFEFSLPMAQEYFLSPFAGNECFLNIHQICFILQPYVHAIVISLFISVYFPSLCFYTSLPLVDLFLFKSSRPSFLAYSFISFFFRPFSLLIHVFLQ